eukprot:403349621
MQFLNQQNQLRIPSSSPPSQQQQQEEEKQSDQLILSALQAFPSIDSLDNFFICKVCLNVIQDAKECGKCQTAFCGKCIQNWIQSKMRGNHQNRASKQQGYPCPLRCEDTEFRDIHRFANEKLKQVQFKCSFEGCQEINTYDKALIHQEFCQNRPIQCGCGQVYRQGSVDQHAQICDKPRVKCNRCREYYNFQQIDQHDCLITYQGIVQQYKNQKDKLEKTIGVLCPNGHCLYPQIGPAEFHIKQFGVKGGNTACDNCRRSMLQKDKMYWRCQEMCDYDLCHKCVYSCKR